MAIIIEGMDNSGKSTLGVALADYANLIIQESEGPPQSDEEINERVDKYEVMTRRVFVRHPVVSNSIYGQVRPEGDPITPGRQLLFYEAGHTFIYCDAGNRGLEAHVRKAHDTDRHMGHVEEHYYKLLELYRAWALKHAHVIYRIGDDMGQAISTAYFHHCYNLED